MSETTKEYKEKVYRSDDIKNLVNLMKTGQGICLVSEKQLGKSRFLRYIANSLEAKSLLEKENIYAVFLDLRNCIDLERGVLISRIQQLLPIKGDFISIEKKLEYNFATLSKIYLVIDHFEEMNRFLKDEILSLRHLRDTFKYQLSFLISYTKEYVVDPQLEPIKAVCPIVYELKPLEEPAIRENILDMLNEFSISLSATKINEIVRESAGYPLRAKQLIFDAFTGHEVTPEFKTTKASESNSSVDKIQTVMTKNEFIVFSLMHSKLNSIVTKNEIAEKINPQFSGAGVTDMAIDQLIKRIRTKLTDNNLNYEVSTKRGVGYILKMALI